MATVKTLTYSNLSHKVLDTANFSATTGLAYKDEAIVLSTTVSSSQTIYVASYNDPFNVISGTFTANTAANRFEIRVTPVEDSSYGVNAGNLVYSYQNIRSGLTADFSFKITSDTFTGSASNTYLICFLAQREIDGKWDQYTSFFVLSDDRTSYKTFIDSSKVAYQVQAETSLLPDTYKAVAFIRSSGAQYISTGCKVSSDMSIYAGLLFNSVASIGLWGIPAASTDSNIRIFGAGSSLYIAHGASRYQQTMPFKISTFYSVAHTHTTCTYNNIALTTSSGSTYASYTLDVMRCNGFPNYYYTSAD